MTPDDIVLALERSGLSANPEIRNIIQRHRASSCEALWAAFVERYLNIQVGPIFVDKLAKEKAFPCFNFKAATTRFCTFCGGELPHHRVDTETP